MQAPSSGLRAILVGLVAFVTTPALAADSTTWLQRQFSTDHRDPTALAPPTSALTSTVSATPSDLVGHVHAQAWLRRQLAGEGFASGGGGEVAGRQHLPYKAEESRPLYHAWLQRILTTAHQELGTRL